MKNKLVLDYSKWRCGKMGEHRLGLGSTKLLNDEGSSCCLGQFLPQLIPATQDKLLGKAYPWTTVNGMAPDLYMDCILFDEIGGHSQLTNKAIDINDNEYTTPEQKIEKLKELFATVNYEIEVINKPE